MTPWWCAPAALAGLVLILVAVAIGSIPVLLAGLGVSFVSIWQMS